MAVAAAAAATVAAAMAAKARDATRLEPLVCFTILLLVLFCYTNVYFRYTQCIKTAMAATTTAPRAQDVSRLEPLVCVFF